MATANTQPRKNEQIKSIDHALETLNEAAQDSSDEIRSMMEKDYKKLKSLFSDTRPQIRSAINELSEASYESAQRAKDQVIEQSKDAAKSVDDSVHNSPWLYIGGAAAAGALAGYLVSRKKKQ